LFDVNANKLLQFATVVTQSR